MLDECCCIYNEEPDQDEDGEFMFYQDWAVALHDENCCECGATIQAGDRYELTTGTWCGRQSIYTTCATCAQIRADFFKCGYTLGRLADELGDCYDLDLV